MGNCPCLAGAGGQAVPSRSRSDAPKVQGVLDDAAVLKLHSAVRWGKALGEVEQLCAEMGVALVDVLQARDPKNGNVLLHIAAQNGHLELTRALLQRGAAVNAANGKGQTALHMSVEYDLYWQTQALLAAGADRQAKNLDGNPAILGIDGGKTGGDAWDHPLTILKNSESKEQLDFALSQLEAFEDKASLDKAALAQAGMAKKKQCKEAWDAPRFMAFVRTLP